MMLTVQEILNSVEKLSVDDREYLFEVLRRRRIEERRAEIAKNAQEALKAVESGTAKRGTFEEIKSYL